MQFVNMENFSIEGYDVVITTSKEQRIGLLKIKKENEIREIKVNLQQEQKVIENDERIREIFSSNREAVLFGLKDWIYKDDFLMKIGLIHSQQNMAIERGNQGGLKKSRAFDNLQALTVSLDAVKEDGSAQLREDTVESNGYFSEMRTKKGSEGASFSFVKTSSLPQVERREFRIPFQEGNQAAIVSLYIFPRNQTPFPSEIVSGFAATRLGDQDVLVSVESIVEAVDTLEKNFGRNRSDCVQAMQNFLGIQRCRVVRFDCSFVKNKLISKGFSLSEAEEIEALLQKNHKKCCEMLAWATSSQVRIKRDFFNLYSMQYSVDEQGAVSVEVTMNKFPSDSGGKKNVRNVLLINGRKEVFTNIVRLRGKAKTEDGISLSKEHREFNMRALKQEEYVTKVLHEQRIPFVTEAVPVCSVTKYEEKEPQLYMKKYIGGDFKDYVIQHRGDPDFLGLALVKMGCFLHALSAMHEKGIYHRDIKLENILIDEYGIADLSDFDSAIIKKDKMFEEQLQYVVGTPGYRPPEQFNFCQDLNIQEMAAADMFAVGVSLFYFLPSLPVEECAPFERDQTFTGDDCYDVFRQQIETVQKKIESLEGSFQEKALCKLISRLISLNPKDRPSAEETEIEIMNLLSSDLKKELCRTLRREMKRKNHSFSSTASGQEELFATSSTSTVQQNRPFTTSSTSKQKKTKTSRSLYTYSVAPRTVPQCSRNNPPKRFNPTVPK